MKKKIIAVLLSACMLVSACPTGAFAMSDEETNTYAATGDVVQGGTPVVDETSAPEATEAPEQTPTPAPEETATPAPAETPAPVEVKAQATVSEIDETEAEETPAPIIDEKEPEGTAAPTVEKTGAEEVPASTEEPAEEGSSAKVNSIATFAARESYSVKVGKTVTLRGTRNPWRCDYTQEWQSSNVAVASVSDSGVVTGNSAGTVTISHTYCSSDYWSDFSWHHNVQTETFTVTVTEPVAPTGITLTGADTVKVYDSIQLTASLTPSNACLAVR